MKYLLLFPAFLLLLSCKNDSRKGDANSKTSISDESQESLKSDGSAAFQEYSNATFHFGLRFPENYKIAESRLSENVPVINVFSSQLSQNPPFGIHEDHSLGYISVLPKGFGVDGPFGKQMSFKEWNKYLPLSFNIDREKSMVYFLENGQPWAFGLYFYTPPKNWQDFGMIFVQFKVNNFESKCFNSKGEPKPMQNCDPMGIHADTIKYFGKVDPESKEALQRILRSLY
ncbi:MAG TPA: hypothetical protein VFI78_03525, partial [Salinimicrobium sp.]|nr:hypothetical protein [Salinimicrobium sp.]